MARRDGFPGCYLVLKAKMRRTIRRQIPHTSDGFTLMELLVALFIIGLLIAITVPAIQQSRASARRMQCSSNLRQIGIAAHNYTESHGQLPFNHLGAGLLFSILPYMEGKTEHDRLETLLSGPPMDQIQAAQTAARFEFYLCPDDGLATLAGASSYDVNRGLLEISGQQRAFVPDGSRSLSWRDVPDGLSQTALCSEMRTGPDIQPGQPPDPRYGNWFVNSTTGGPPLTRSELVQFANDCVTAALTSSPYTPAASYSYISSNVGYNHVGMPNSPACQNAGLLFSFPASSNHSGGVNLLLADGAVKFVATHIDINVWRALGSRDGGEIESSSF